MPAKRLTPYIFIIIAILISLSIFHFYTKAKVFGAPPYAEDNIYEDFRDLQSYPNDFSHWKRPGGPIRIGIQVGHWKTEELPDELEHIRESGQGTTGQGKAESEIMLPIAQKVKEILENEGYLVDLIPATVPENYWADAFIAIHADGNVNPWVSGYKVASSQRDKTGKALDLAVDISTTYQETTGFPLDPNITANMTRYYAFNSRRYLHSIHPMTPGVIVETGFATNYRESSILINRPDLPAEGIAKGIINFINSQNIEK